MIEWLKNFFNKVSVYHGMSKEELENEISFFYEKMVTATSLKEEASYKEILEGLDKQYRKML